MVFRDQLTQKETQWLQRRNQRFHAKQSLLYGDPVEPNVDHHEREIGNPDLWHVKMPQQDTHVETETNDLLDRSYRKRKSTSNDHVTITKQQTIFE